MKKNYMMSGAVIALLLMVIILLSPLRRTRAHTQARDTLSIGTPPFDVYVINLSQHTHRMRVFLRGYHATDLSKTHGLIRFEGVLGSTVPLAEVTSTKALQEVLRSERLKYRQKHYELTRGAVGAFLSHSRLWRSVLDTDKDVALVFEDDCAISPNIMSILNKIPMPADADMVLLGYFCNKCTPAPFSRFLLRVHKFFGLHAYMITRRGIEKILGNKKMSEISKQIDAVLSDMIRDQELNVYAVQRPIAVQNGMPTTIQMTLKKVPGVDEWSDD